MDELSCTSRIARRLALAATICCCATSVHADTPPGTTQTQSFRSLLSQGWSESKPLETTDRKTSKPAVVKVAPSVMDVTPSPAVIAAAPKSPTKSMIVRPKLKVLEVPHSVRTNSKSSASDKISTTSQPRSDRDHAAPRAAASLAELIKRRSKPIIVPQRTSDSESIHIEQAPTAVNRLDIEKQVSENLARMDSNAESNVRAAEPIQALSELNPEKVSVVAATPTPAVEFEAPIRNVEKQISRPQLAQTEPVQTEPIETEPVQTEPVQTEPIETEPVQTEPVQTEPVQTELAQSEPGKPEPAKAATTQTPTQAPTVDETPRTAVSEIVSAPVTDRSRRLANDSGFQLLPLKSFEPDSAAKLESGSGQPSLTATIHATRLREIAQESLDNAKHRLQRRATHSAKKFALEALRSIVAMRDAESRSNVHARQLDAAFDAIRESEDFCGRFGAIDPNALSRMVAVHETDALKNQNVEHVSALQATETYLDVARANLVLAAGGEREASDALVLLGQIEKEMSHRGDTHGAAVAVTLQRAAVEIEPTSAIGYRELGVTLLKQGLVEQAAWALNRSVEIQPTRSGYQRLLEASRRLGDVDTARVCLTSLQKPELQRQIPVKTLSPQDFAATHRPTPQSIEPAKVVQPRPAVKESPQPAEEKVSLRSLIPFGRR